MTHDRAFVRPLLRRIATRPNAFAEILAHRAAHFPELAAHLLVALDEVETRFPDPAAHGEPRPQIVK